MAAFDFPNSPNTNDTYTANGMTFIWNGSVWKKDASAGTKGEKGEKGNKGQKGEIGDKGEKGEKGQKGEIGVGVKGQKGELNDKGQKGEVGVTGTVFTSGTRMLFQQTSAPTGWTKDTSLNNRALRIVNGSVGSGGGNGFAEVLNSTVTTSSGSVSSHTLTTAQIPAHFHYAFRSGNHGQHRTGSNLSSNNYPGSGSGASNLYEGYNISASNSQPNVGRTQEIGSSQGHSHGFTNPSFNLNVLYTDVIIAQKN